MIAERTFTFAVPNLMTPHPQRSGYLMSGANSFAALPQFELSTSQHAVPSNCSTRCATLQTLPRWKFTGGPLKTFLLFGISRTYNDLGSVRQRMQSWEPQSGSNVTHFQKCGNKGPRGHREATGAPWCRYSIDSRTTLNFPS